MMLSAAFATVACSDDYVDWANPQANDPEEQVALSRSLSHQQRLL